MIQTKEKSGKVRKQKNRRARAAKISHYKVLQVVSCFAGDLSIRQASLITRLSERALRDLYAKIRQRMVEAVLDDPGVFNGVNALFIDRYGRLEPQVLSLLIATTHTKAFKERLRGLYPRTNVRSQPMLHHAIEYFVRRYIAVQLPIPSCRFREDVAVALHMAAALARLGTQGKAPPVRERAFWAFGRVGLILRCGANVRRYKDNGQDRLLRDLRKILLDHPL